MNLGKTFFLLGRMTADFDSIHGVVLGVVEKAEMIVSRTPYGAEGAEAVKWLLIFLRTPSSFETLAATWADKLPRGWRGAKQYKAKVEYWMPRVAQCLFPHVVEALNGKFRCAEETELMVKLFGQRVRGAMDSVPVHADAPAHYNTHYKANIFKLFVVADFRGFIEHVSGPYNGVYDDQILRRTGWKPRIDGDVYLGDGHFSGPFVLKPLTGPQLKKRCQQDPARTFEILAQNERLGFCRARVEHVSLEVAAFPGLHVANKPLIHQVTAAQQSRAELG